uniref:Ovule protein n=1 Tax=Elaeophora elaphi TaxID=1147741 RepID=A0A0R3RJL5_9BILA
MDEIPTMEHLSYGKDELQAIGDMIPEDNFEIIPNLTTTAMDPFNQQDCSIESQMESMRLSANYPMKLERRTSLDECIENTTEAFAEDSILQLQQKHCDQNSFSGKESFPEIHLPAQESLLPDQRIEEMHDVGEKIQDNIDHELPGNEMSNDAYFNSSIKETSDGFELINYNNDATAVRMDESNLKISNSPIKTSRPKIEETEMPTKGVVSNLKTLFESNAVHNNNDTCKGASYKLG